MIRALLICALLVSQLALAEEIECDFDQGQQISQMRALQKKYPGSRLVENNRLLVIPVEEGQVRLGIGGCAHYGISIELVSRYRDRYRSEEALMRRARALVKKYDEKIIDYERMRADIRAKRWTKETSPILYYVLQYDDVSVFEIRQEEEAGNIVIGVSVYL